MTWSKAVRQGPATWLHVLRTRIFRTAQTLLEIHTSISHPAAMRHCACPVQLGRIADQARQVQLGAQQGGERWAWSNRVKRTAPFYCTARLDFV